MKKTIFITGYPGFLASDLLAQLFADHRDNIKKVYVLVLESEKRTAAEKLTYFMRKTAIPAECCSLAVGDITKNNLGLVNDFSDVTHVFHLAAIYDLAVPKHIAEKVNVHGTEMVNAWVQSLAHIERYIYFSTAYVSGKREGTIYEHELIKGQSFRNHYEQTKYEAEILVEEMKPIVPTTIIRPGIVKGNSKTGHTIKFDGLYFMLNFYEALRHSPVIPYLKAGPSPEGNFISSDYLVQAVSYLAMNPIGAGKTYHLTDPKPYHMTEIQKAIAEHYLGRTPKGILDVSLAKLFLTNARIRKYLGVELEALDYFIYQSSYDATQAAADLQTANIYCPDLMDTLPVMISFYRKYKDDYTKQLNVM